MLSAAIDGMLPSADRLQTDALHRAEGARHEGPVCRARAVVTLLDLQPLEGAPTRIGGQPDEPLTKLPTRVGRPWLGRRRELPSQSRCRAAATGPRDCSPDRSGTRATPGCR